MCGIAGGTWRRGRRVPSLDGALARVRHRGPNDRGVETWSGPDTTVALGQTRLSIIDLTAGGHQPMVARGEDYVLVFNGEIYNYRELRLELQALGRVFDTRSDTEVLLAAWQQWGAACLSRLDGMFAFAIHDRRMHKLFLARDAFGIKPLFFWHKDHSLIFASEVAALLTLCEERPAPDILAGYRYLVHGLYDIGDRTFYDGVRHLRAGHLLTLDLASGTLDLEKWWAPNIAQTCSLSFDDAAEATREAFLVSIKRQLRSDVPLGAALSGGIDSSAVVCAIRHLEPDMPIHAFSYIAAGTDISEESWAQMVVQRTGAQWYRSSATANDLARDLDDLMTAQGEPFGSTSIYAQYRVFKLAKENGMTVTLDGQGADELLAGYIGYPGSRLLSLVERGQWSEALSFLQSWSKWPGRSHKAAAMSMAARILPERAYGVALSLMGRSKPEWVNQEMIEDVGLYGARVPTSPAGRGRRVSEELAFQLQQSGLPQLLRHGDRNSMAFSIESRVPFLTVPLAELLLSLPEEYLISPKGETKSVFRAAMRGIVPDAILDRRDKIGFAAPERDWTLTLAPTFREWLHYADHVPFLKRKRLLQAFDEIIAGKRAFNWQIWRWVNYVRWYAHNF